MKLNAKTIFICMLVVYVLACFIDLTAPMEANRGSWWNVFYHILVAICQ